MIFTTLTYNGVEKTLADWHLSASSLRWTAQISQVFTCTMVMAADAPDPFPFKAKIIIQTGRIVPAAQLPPNGSPPSGLVNVFSGGTVEFIGFLLSRGKRSATGTQERITFKFSDIFATCFARLNYQTQRNSWNGTEQTVVSDLEVILGYAATWNFENENYISIRQQLCLIAAWAAAASATEFGAPQFQFDTLTHAIDGTNYDLIEGTTANCSIPDYVPGTYGTIEGAGTCISPLGNVLRCCLDGVNNINCAEAFRRTLRPVGGPGKCAVWFDYTQTPPMLKVFTQDALPSKTLAFVGNTYASDIMSRDELVPNAVDLHYHIVSQSGGNTYVQIVRDIAATIGGTVLEGVGTVGELTTVTGGSISTANQNALIAAGQGTQSVASTVDIDGGSTSTSNIQCIALDFSDPSPDPTALACWEALEPSFAGGGVTNLKLLSGSLSVVDKATGLTVDYSPYSYVLLTGGVATWMYSGATQGAFANVIVKASFSYTGRNGQICASEDYALDAILTNLPSGSYNATNSPAEPVPYGLASFIYNQQKILQYQGSYTLVEQDVTAAFTPGFNLNLSGGLPEWATMNAYVTEIEYDFLTGFTRLAFGPHAALSAQELVDNMRRDRGPRGVLFFSSNLLNASS